MEEQNLNVSNTVQKDSELSTAPQDDVSKGLVFSSRMVKSGRTKSNFHECRLADVKLSSGKVYGPKGDLIGLGTGSKEQGLLGKALEYRALQGAKDRAAEIRYNEQWEKEHASGGIGSIGESPTNGDAEGS